MSQSESLDTRQAGTFDLDSIPKETKLELISRLAKTGVTTIEAGSFVPAKWVPQVSFSLHMVRNGD